MEDFFKETRYGTKPVKINFYFNTKTSFEIPISVVNDYYILDILEQSLKYEDNNTTREIEANVFLFSTKNKSDEIIKHFIKIINDNPFHDLLNIIILYNNGDKTVIKFNNVNISFQENDTYPRSKPAHNYQFSFS